MWVVKKSKVHGTGVFANSNISKNKKIIQYIGERVTKSEGDRRSAERIKKYLNKKNEGSVYIFELNKKYDIDGSPLYNKARYINHSCSPNCEVDIIKNEIWISSIKKIKKGEELNYDYGYPFDEDDYSDHICKCNTNKCIGYIISKDDWPKYNKFVKKNKKNKKNA
jgi:SET domain-containing protein